MADNKKIYTIQINGIEQSIKQVDALSDALQFIDKKIKELESKKVNLEVDTTTKGTSSKDTSRISNLQTEDKLLKQIKNTEEQIANARREDYARLQAEKDILKEITNEQKKRAATERLTANNYSNTMAGMKQELADVKTVRNFTDVTSQEFDKLTKRALQLTNQLKELEEETGQFGRNVGNYKSAAEGFSKYKIEVGGVVREFNSAREAAKTLANELLNLPKGAKGAKELRAALQQVKSELRDLEKSTQVMDDLLDTMESFAAMGQITNGFSALFGFDNDEIQRSIQKLVALQNVMQGIEKINKQLNTQEGIGKFLSKGNDQIDTANFKLKRITVSMLGTGTAAKVAATGVNLLTTAAKALSSIGLFAIISAAALAIDKVVAAISDWVKGNSDLESSEKNLKIAIDSTNETLERRLELNKAKENAGRLSSTERLAEDEKAYAEAIMEANKELEKRASIDPKNQTFAKAYNGGQTWDDFLKNDKGVTTLGGFSEAAKDIDELTKRYNELSKAVDNNTSLTYKNAKGFEIAHLSASDVKDELNHIEQFMGGQLLNTMTKFNLKTEEGRKGLANWVNGIMSSNNDLRKSILLKLPEIVSNNEGKFGDALTNYLTHIRTFVRLSNQEMNILNFEGFANKILDAADKTGKRLKEKQLKELDDRYNALSKEEQKAQGLLYAQARQAIIKEYDDKNKKITSNYKKEQKTVQDAEKKLTDLELRLMDEGLNKKLRQLDEEERQTINKLKENGRKTAAEVEKIQRSYNQLRQKEIKEYLASLDKTINESSKNNRNIELNININDIENQLDTLKNEFDKISSKTFRFDELISRNDLNNIFYNTSGITHQRLEDAYNYLEALKENQQEVDDLFELEYKEELSIVSSYGSQILNVTQENLKKGDDFLANSLRKRSRDLRFYYATTITQLTENIKQQGKLNEILINEQTQKAEDAERARWESQAESLWKQKENIDKQISNFKVRNNEEKEALEKLKADKKGIEDQLYKAEALYIQNMIGLTIKKNNAIKKNELDTLKEIQAVQSQYFDAAISNYRQNLSKMNDEASLNPVRNSFGFVNVKETKKNYNDILNQSKETLDQLKEDKLKLNVLYATGFIDDKAYNETIGQLTDIEKSVKNTQTSVENSSKNLFTEVASNINQYVQQFGQSLNQVLQSVWQYQDAEYEANIEQLDKFIEKWNDKMNEQEQIAEEHKNAMEAIEGELATARGDRRQQLIDGLNAEILAQRNALREKKKAEKEAQKLEKKKEEEALEQRKREHDRAVTQAIISANLAVANALTTQPFWPVGVAMGILATTLGAVQVALIKSQHYANGGILGDGGVIQGKSHAQGGVKVLGGRAEVEGGEFITNKATTSKNVDLLEFINSKRKRINIDDLIEFYGGNSPIKKNIQTVRTKFADGGVVPTLRNDIELNDRLVTAMEDYSNRPVQVAVVDIMDRTQQVNEVKVMAGLSE